MKIIDAKGKVFKRLNIFDLTLVLLAVLFITAAYLRIASPGRGEIKITDACTYRTVIVEGILDWEWMADYVSAGDSQTFEEDVRLEVLGVERKKLNPRDESPKAIVKFKVPAKVNYNGILSVGRHPLLPGARFNIYLRDYCLNGVIYKVYDGDSGK